MFRSPVPFPSSCAGVSREPRPVRVRDRARTGFSRCMRSSRHSAIRPARAGAASSLIIVSMRVAGGRTPNPHGVWGLAREASDRRSRSEYGQKGELIHPAPVPERRVRAKRRGDRSGDMGDNVPPASPESINTKPLNALNTLKALAVFAPSEPHRLVNEWSSVEADFLAARTGGPHPDAASRRAVSSATGNEASSWPTVDNSWA